MICPNCKAEGYDRVMQTYQLEGCVKRRRKCLNCGKIFYTEERIVERIGKT